jgi:hypothetical protein
MNLILALHNTLAIPLANFSALVKLGSVRFITIELLIQLTPLACNVAKERGSASSLATLMPTPMKYSVKREGMEGFSSENPHASRASTGYSGRLQGHLIA